MTKASPKLPKEIDEELKSFRGKLKQSNNIACKNKEMAIGEAIRIANEYYFICNIGYSGKELEELYNK